jgi:Bacterial surface proteins containing Ig-like domains
MYEEYLSPGTYYVQMKSGYDTPYTLKYVAYQYVTGIQLKSSLIVVTKGTSVNLLSAVTPSDATQKTLKWTTSDSSVATVSSAGKVIAKATDYAIITATTTDGSNISKKATVIVRPTKASLKKVTLSKYNKRQISITAKSQKNVTYQYQYAKNKKFKKPKSIRSSYASLTTSTLSKKKKYYVMVRAYYTYNGKNYYGVWSKVKSIRTKK